MRRRRGLRRGLRLARASGGRRDPRPPLGGLSCDRALYVGALGLSRVGDQHDSVVLELDHCAFRPPERPLLANDDRSEELLAHLRGATAPGTAEAVIYQEALRQFDIALGQVRSADLISGAAQDADVMTLTLENVGVFIGVGLFLHYALTHPKQ